MRWIAVALCGAWLVFSTPAPRAQDAGTREAIRAVIAGQIEAFRQDDGPQAFGYAAPGIKTIFGTPERFMEMVKSTYQPVYRPREVEFRDLVTEGGVPTQKVLLVGPDGLPVIASYTMEQQPDGTWKISGCSLEATAEVTT